MNKTTHTCICKVRKDTNRAVSRNYLWGRRLPQERGNFDFLSPISLYCLHSLQVCLTLTIFQMGFFTGRKKKNPDRKVPTEGPHWKRGCCTCRPRRLTDILEVLGRDLKAVQLPQCVAVVINSCQLEGSADFQKCNHGLECYSQCSFAQSVPFIQTYKHRACAWRQMGTNWSGAVFSLLGNLLDPTIKSDMPVEVFSKSTLSGSSRVPPSTHPAGQPAILQIFIEHLLCNKHHFF